MLRSGKGVLFSCLSCVLSLAPVARLTAQDKPDFSGSWILQDPQPPPADVPKALTVRQPLTRTNVRGEPMPPAYLKLTVDKFFGDEVRTETHDIGVEGGSVGDNPEDRRFNTHYESYWSVRWEGDRLRIHILSYGPTPEWFTEHSEVWAFDKSDRLVITLVDRQLGSDAVTRTLTYRRR